MSSCRHRVQLTNSQDRGGKRETGPVIREEREKRDGVGENVILYYLHGLAILAVYVHILGSLYGVISNL